MIKYEKIRSWLQQKIADMEAARDEIPFGLDEDDSNTLAALRIALASLEAEPVCVIDQSNLDYLKSGSDADVWPTSRTEMGDVFLYRAAPTALVSVPDDSAITQHFDTIALETAREIMCDVNRRHEFLGGEVQLLSRIQCRIDDACRAAMLQGADGALTNEDTKRVDELVMWIKRLAHSLRKANPDSKLQSDAMDYLSRKGLIGVKDILR
ncbi:TPA: hypothetical protein ACH1PF_002472 [Enterobacter cloacae]